MISKLNGFYKVPFIMGLFSLIFLLPSVKEGFALSDYSDADKESGGISVNFKDKETDKKGFDAYKPINNSQAPLTAPSSSPNVPSQMSLKNIDMGTLYESMTLNKKNENSGENQSAKVDLLRAKIFLQTPYNVFMDASYFAARSDTSWLSPRKKSFQQGNPKISLGFNWLKIGNIDERAQFDIFAGVSLKTKNSDFGASRNDQFAGIRTTKNFHYFVIGLLGEMNMIGKPSDPNETAIGNITRLGGALAWIVSTDITFQVEAYHYQISPYKKDWDEKKKLQHSVSFSGVSPKLLLGLSPHVELMLGGSFKTKKMMPEDQNRLIAAKLYDLIGVYGNSIYAGLDFSL